LTIAKSRKGALARSSAPPPEAARQSLMRFCARSRAGAENVFSTWAVSH
jgi:HD superfamily phosphodiesterase